MSLTDKTAQVVITAVGPDNRRLADPIVHHVTSAGANISEIQMYDHDAERLFAMLVRTEWPVERQSVAALRSVMTAIGEQRGLSIRTWCRDENEGLPRLAICVTHHSEAPRAVLEALRENKLGAVPAVMIGNRPACGELAAQFGVSWHMVGDAEGNPDNERMVEILDRSQVDYIVLARYMRILPARTCWGFAGGRIINLHHGLLPSFPGQRPYHDAYGHRMLTYGATVHFIVPELDAGNQIIHQSTFTVSPGTPLAEIIRRGQTEHEPACLVEGVRRVIDREVELHFHRVVRTRTI